MRRRAEWGCIRSAYRFGQKSTYVLEIYPKKLGVNFRILSGKGGDPNKHEVKFLGDPWIDEINLLLSTTLKPHGPNRKDKGGTGIKGNLGNLKLLPEEDVRW